MILPPTIRAYERRAAEIMEPGPHGYYAGGAGDEVTLRDNVDAWSRLAIHPRVMVDVSVRDPGTTLLGRERPHPLIVAPTAFHGLATPERELATARAACAAGAIYCLSTLASTGPVEVAETVPDVPRWFQLYVYRDRGATREVVRAAAEHGYEALVVTVDLPVLGLRERDHDTGFHGSAATEVPTAAKAGHAEPIGIAGAADLIDPSLTWADIESLAAESGLPVLVKGVLTPDDALRAAAHGAAGIVVSNHGGRQLDTVLSGADALAPIVEAVGDDLDVLVDGGIRRGTDVLKALALGARAVMVGRPILWGLAVGGEAGARHVLELLLAQFDNALALAGVPVAAQLDGSLIAPAPWARARG